MTGRAEKAAKESNKSNIFAWIAALSSSGILIASVSFMAGVWDYAIARSSVPIINKYIDAHQIVDDLQDERIDTLSKYLSIIVEMQRRGNPELYKSVVKDQEVRNVFK